MVIRVFLRRPIQYTICAWFVVGFLCACHGNRIERFLHQDFAVVWPLPAQELRGSEFQPIAPKQASWFAVQHLVDRGVKDVVICEIRWIAAPLGGYLIDAQGRLSLNDSVYTLFRIGVRDGTQEAEGRNAAGEEFVFIALGMNHAGETVWYPSPGPDYNITESEVFPIELLAYEFLLDREKFVSLAERYP